MVGVSDVLPAVRQIATELVEKNVTFMAAGIAYNAFLSLAPILVVLLVAISAVGGGLQARVIEITRNALPGPIADVVVKVFQGGAADPTASVVGVVVFVWGSLKIFRGLDTAFSEIYETTKENSFVDKLVDAVIVLMAIVVAIVATVGVTAVFAAFEEIIPYVGVLTPLVLIVGLVVAFIPMYYRFPDTEVAWTHVFPGAAFAAVGWAAFQALFQVYLSFTAGGTDSLFGGVVVVITWLYFSGLVLLLGAVINAVLGGHTSGARDGVGRDATEYETRPEEKLTRDEFVAYLENIRDAVVDHDGGPAPTTAADITSQNLEPLGDVTVTKQAELEEDERKLSVAFRWRTTASDSDDHAMLTDG